MQKQGEAYGLIAPIRAQGQAYMRLQAHTGAHTRIGG